MADQSDLIKLYSNRILALAADIPHLGRLNDAQGSALRRSPVCGSEVTVDLVMNGAQVAEFAQDVKACALGQASAAIAGQNIIGATRADILQARDQLAAMLAGSGDVPTAPFSGYDVLTPAIAFKNRHGSILLTLEATLDAIDAAQSQAHAQGATVP